MALVDLIDVKLASANPCPFGTAFEFEITFECVEGLDDDLEWKITYVGSAEDMSKDQVLEEVMVGPVPLGTSRFTLQAPAPSLDQIPDQDLLGVTVVSITCAYKEQPFINVGYYVNNEYYAEGLPGNGVPPTDAAEIPRPIDVSKVFRNVCADQPRVTRYGIRWATLATPEGEGGNNGMMLSSPTGGGDDDDDDSDDVDAAMDEDAMDEEDGEEVAEKKEEEEEDEEEEEGEETEDDDDEDEDGADADEIDLEDDP